MALYSIESTSASCPGVGEILTIQPYSLSVSKVIVSFPNGVSGGWVFSAIVSGNTLTIPLQKPSSVGSNDYSDWTVSGSASLNDNYLFLERHCDSSDNAPCTTCSYNCVKM